MDLITGSQQTKKVSIEDLGDEERDTFETKLKKEGSFSCVEVKVESERATVEDLVNSSSCVIEEYSESEDKAVKLSISRNVSIHSMSDDEGYKQTPLPLDTPELEIKDSFDFEIKDSVNTVSKESKTKDLIASSPNKAILSVQEKSDSTEASHQIVEETSPPQKAALLQKETQESGKIPDQHVKDDTPVQNKSIKKSVSFAETEDLLVESVDSVQKLNQTDSIERSQNAELMDGKETKNDSIPLQAAKDTSNDSLSPSLNESNELEPQEQQVCDHIEERKLSLSSKDQSQSDDVFETENIVSKASSESNSCSRKASVERRESLSKVDVTNVVETRRSSKGFIFNEVNKGQLFESLESVSNGSSSAQSGDTSDTTGDSKTDELIKRIKKQRSVLEEILDKEEERNIEGTIKITINATYALISQSDPNYSSLRFLWPNSSFHSSLKPNT